MNWFTRLKQWLCGKLGHRYEWSVPVPFPESNWAPIHGTCRRCGHETKMWQLTILVESMLNIQQTRQMGVFEDVDLGGGNFRSVLRPGTG